MHAAAEKIRGLHTHSAGEEPYRVLAIGWDRSAVWSAAAEAAAPGYKKLAMERDMEGQARMDQHRKFVKAVSGGKKGTQKAKQQFDMLSQATGEYLVECEHIEEQWSHTAQDGLHMKIVADSDHRGRLVAEFDFGVLEGIMRFRKPGEEPLPDDGRASGKKKKLDTNAYFEEEEEEEEDTTSDSESEDELLEDDGYNKPFSASNKRKQSSSSLTAAKRKPNSQPAGRSQVKKTRPSPSQNLKLLFLWRGRETGEGEIQLDYDQSNKGFIEFRNSDCLTFAGVMDSPYFTKAKLSGYKVARDDGKGIRTTWEEFSEEVYERQRVSRWH